ncbi:hypothetical protein L6452_22437 [Arctium lappa]|uniref:Uncharacterized protein n=1 Tax=Arctium lappa TaxID=4217 RepID=A0ACB9B0M6_ARCLA|nr:hypothetical protein L6452_22437 [Arctium lappa]
MGVRSASHNRANKKRRVHRRKADVDCPCVYGGGGDWRLAHWKLTQPVNPRIPNYLALHFRVQSSQLHEPTPTPTPISIDPSFSSSSRLQNQLLLLLRSDLEVRFLIHLPLQTLVGRLNFQASFETTISRQTTISIQVLTENEPNIT